MAIQFWIYKSFIIFLLQCFRRKAKIAQMETPSILNSSTNDCYSMQIRVVRTKFDIYVFSTITGSIPLLVDN